MKQLQFFLLTIFSLTFLLASCKGDDAGPDAGSGKLTATVDGQSWKSKDGANGAVYAESQGTHTIQAYHTDGSYLGLTIFGAITSGTTYETTNGAFQAQYKPDFGKTEAFVTGPPGSSGTITFTTVSGNLVKGTFLFTGVMFDATGAQTELEVKNGSFEFDL